MFDFLSTLVILAAPALALPIVSEASPAQSDTKKYPKDKGVFRQVYAYILAVAGCFIVLGLIYFAIQKFRRGERVCPGVKRRVKQKNVWHGEKEMDRLPLAKPNASKRTVLSMYGADNPYAWTPERSYVPTSKRGHQAQIPRVKQPAPVAQPMYGVAARRLSPGIPIQKILPDRSGFYNVQLLDENRSMR